MVRGLLHSISPILLYGYFFKAKKYVKRHNRGTKSTATWQPCCQKGFEESGSGRKFLDPSCNQFGGNLNEIILFLFIFPLYPKNKVYFEKLLTYFFCYHQIVLSVESVGGSKNFLPEPDSSKNFLTTRFPHFLRLWNLRNLEPSLLHQPSPATTY